MNEYFIPVASTSFAFEEPETPENHRMLALYAEYLIDLVKKNYTGELKTKISYIFQEIDEMDFDDIKKTLIKIILTDIQDTLLYDASEDYLRRVGDKLRMLKEIVAEK